MNIFVHFYLLSPVSTVPSPSLTCLPVSPLTPLTCHSSPLSPCLSSDSSPLSLQV